MRGPAALPPGGPDYHVAALLESFGGWYPEPGQLEKCAAPYFDLIHQEDGTHDYYLTSEYWLKRFQWSAAFDPRVWWALAQKLWEQPRALAKMLRLQVWDQSWCWQFRAPAPMQLLRQTWQAK
jgi:hypothetical protein